MKPLFFYPPICTKHKSCFKLFTCRNNWWFFTNDYKIPSTVSMLINSIKYPFHNFSCDYIVGACCYHYSIFIHEEKERNSMETKTTHLPTTAVHWRKDFVLTSKQSSHSSVSVQLRTLQTQRLLIFYHSLLRHLEYNKGSKPLTMTSSNILICRWRLGGPEHELLPAPALRDDRGRTRTQVWSSLCSLNATWFIDPLVSNVETEIHVGKYVKNKSYKHECA